MLWSLGLPLQAAPPASIRLAMIEGVPALTRAPAEIVRQAYRDVGLDIELVAMPVARALTEANAGRVDGELGRFSNIEDNAPNLRRVPFPIGLVSYAPYVLAGSKHDFSSLAAIRQSGASIGVRLGARIVEEPLGDAVRVHHPSYDGLLKMLLVGRVDVVIAPVGQLEHDAGLLDAEYSSKFHTVTRLKPVVTQPLFHYVHERYSARIPALTKALETMSRDGSIGKTWRKAEMAAQFPGR